MKLKYTQGEWVLIWICIIVVFIAIIVMFGGDDQNNKPDVGTKMDACYMSHQFLEKFLKSPSTAKFERCFDATVKYDGYKTYYVYSHVDSQNEFGAMLRTEYIAEVLYISNDRWRLVDYYFN